MIVQVRNATNKLYILSKNAKIDMLRDFEKENYYNVLSNDRHLTAVFFRNWTKTFRNVAIMSFVEVFVDFTTIVANNAFNSTMQTQVFSTISLMTNSTDDKSLKIVMFNEITIFDHFFVYNILSIVAEIYFEIWRNTNDIVDVSKKKWISISTISNVKSNANKIYSLNSKNRKVVDKEFDRHHNNDKMSWTTKSTLYKYSIFVV